MIRLQRRRAGTMVPAPFRGQKLAKKTADLIDRYYAAKAANKPMSFDSAEWKSAKIALKKDSNGKCAYCEASTAVVAHGDVEHFRPKSIYWWLAYCFDNYLYSCQICNQTHKGDHFPTGAPALQPIPMPPVKPTGAALDALVAQLTMDASVTDDATVSSLWAGEDAALIHPYFEDPAPLLAYEPDDDNEEMWVRSAGGPRADRVVATTETVLGINRELLLRERYAQYLPLATLKVLLDEPLSETARGIATREVVRLQKASEPFSGMRRWFAAQWDLPGPA